LAAPHKTERLDARVTSETKSAIQHAAALEGLSVSDFIVQAAKRSAEETIRSHEVITLSAEASQAFAETLLNPAEPNAALIKALRSARSRFHE